MRRLCYGHRANKRPDSRNRKVRKMLNRGKIALEEVCVFHVVCCVTFVLGVAEDGVCRGSLQELDLAFLR